jgi:hypothetical protein
MSNMSIGGYKVGDSIGAGQVIHPSQKGDFAIQKRVTIDTNGNGKADKGDQMVLVGYKGRADRAILPAFQDLNADNKTVRSFQRLKTTNNVGAGMALAGFVTGFFGLGACSKGAFAGGAALFVAGGGIAIGAFFAERNKERKLVEAHVSGQIPNFVPAK